MKSIESTVSPDTVIAFRDITMTYGDTTVLDLPNLDIPRGFTVIAGASGSGKSTALNIAAGFVEPKTGVVAHYIDGSETMHFVASCQSPTRKITRLLTNRLVVETAAERHLAKYRSAHTGYIGQSAELEPNFAMREYTESVHAMRKTNVDPRHVQLLCNALSLTPDIRARRPSEVSGGQEQREAIVAALAHKPELVFADEPTSDLDPESKKRALELFALACQAGASVIMVTHDVDAAKPFADRFITFSEGQAIDPTIRPAAA